MNLFPSFFAIFGFNYPPMCLNVVGKGGAARPKSNINGHHKMVSPYLAAGLG
jgi:hypothetical protein